MENRELRAESASADAAVVSGIRDALTDMAKLFESHNLRYEELTRALDSNESTELFDFITSNTLWGGSGSIADSALIDESEARSSLQEILVRLGKLQQKIGRVNVRTEMWTSAFSPRP